MDATHDDEDMVKYQFQAEDEVWEAWKNTVPRSKSLEQRIVELIEADTDGRVVDLEELDRALDDIEAAAERGDGPGLQEALSRAREVIPDGQSH